MGLLWLIALILLIMWLFGFLITPFGGSLVHILLVIALILLIVWLFQRVRVRS